MGNHPRLPQPGCTEPGIDGVVVASITHSDDERGEFHLVLSVDPLMPGSYYRVAVYEYLGSRWVLRWDVCNSAYHAHRIGDICRGGGRFPNIVPAVRAYEDYGGEW